MTQLTQKPVKANVAKHRPAEGYTRSTLERMLQDPESGLIKFEDLANSKSKSDFRLTFRNPDTGCERVMNVDTKVSGMYSLGFGVEMIHWNERTQSWELSWGASKGADALEQIHFQNKVREDEHVLDLAWPVPVTLMGRQLTMPLKRLLEALAGRAIPQLDQLGLGDIKQLSWSKHPVADPVLKTIDPWLTACQTPEGKRTVSYVIPQVAYHRFTEAGALSVPDGSYGDQTELAAAMQKIKDNERR